MAFKSKATETDNKKAILNAWNAGKKTCEVVLDGKTVKVKLQKQVKQSIVYAKDKEPVKKEMTWIVASPANKFAFVPLFSVALGNNSKVL